MQPDTEILPKKPLSLLSSCTATGGAHMDVNNSFYYLLSHITKAAKSRPGHYKDFKFYYHLPRFILSHILKYFSRASHEAPTDQRQELTGQCLEFRASTVKLQWPTGQQLELWNAACGAWFECFCECSYYLSNFSYSKFSVLQPQNLLRWLSLSTRQWVVTIMKQLWNLTQLISFTLNSTLPSHLKS